MRAALRYFGLFLGLTLLTALALTLVETIVGPLGGGVTTVTSIAAVIGAASFEGQFFAKREGRIPERAEKRAFARLALLVNIVFGAATLAILVTLIPELRRTGVYVFVALTMVIIFAIIYFASGYFFAKYAKDWLAAQERKRARSAG